MAALKAPAPRVRGAKVSVSNRFHFSATEGGTSPAFVGAPSEFCARVIPAAKISKEKANPTRPIYRYGCTAGRIRNFWIRGAEASTTRGPALEALSNLGIAGLQERRELGGVAGQAREGRDGALVRIDDRIVGNGHGAEALLFKLLVLLGVGVGAIGIEVDQNEILQQPVDLRAREHIGLHPMAVGAGIAGKVDKNQLVFGARFGQR